MVEINSDKIDKTLLMNEIDKQAKKIKKEKTTKKIRPIEKEKIYTVEDFTHYHDEEFIKTVYLHVLKREADKESLEHYLMLLRNGLMSKSEILAVIRFSPEGRQHNVNILGIKKRYFITRLYQLPKLGYFFKSVVALLRLPKLVQRYNAFEANYLLTTKNMHEEIANKVNKTVFHSETEELKKEIQVTKQRLSEEQAVFTKEINDLNVSLALKSEKFEKDMHYYVENLNNTRTYIKEIQNNLENLMQKIEKSIVGKEILTQEVYKEIAQEKQHFLDDLYIAFEDRFRGSRKDIKQRQEYYLPIIEEVVQDKSELILDVGCGRGEWLELLKENGFTAKGVDLNRAMVHKSQEYSLDAVTMDAIAYLKSLPDESLRVVSGFHIVEHLPFEVLIALLDESLRILKKGGIVIFETPNPENILVGSCTFYTDPTHINPIPPVTLEFLAQNRGFNKVEVHRLHPLKEPDFMQGDNMGDINNLVYAAAKEQDYSIIGYK